jgi:hypothetical protein
MLVAAIAEAMQPQTTVEKIIDTAIESHLKFAARREGPRWQTLAWRYDPNLKFLKKGLEIARREKDVFALQKSLYETLEWGHLFSEATHTLVVALAMFVAAEGDFRQTVIGCVMYGRDNDSYASVAGALAGAFHGVEAIPKEWIQPVTEANPETDMHDLSLKITELIIQDYEKSRAALEALRALW